MKELHDRRNEWFRYAEDDWQIAKLAFEENGPPNPICFHAQQIAEKYLKGFLVGHGETFEKVHQLPYLLEMCEKIKPSFQELRKDAFLLNEFYIEPRYPGDFPEFARHDAQEALEAAARVKEFVVSISSA